MKVEPNVPDETRKLKTRGNTKPNSHVKNWAASYRVWEQNIQVHWVHTFECGRWSRIAHLKYSPEHETEM